MNRGGIFFVWQLAYFSLFYADPHFPYSPSNAFQAKIETLNFIFNRIYRRNIAKVQNELFLNYSLTKTVFWYYFTIYFMIYKIYKIFISTYSWLRLKM